jgi:Bacterial pre-peptidase C-terminal domain
MKTKLQTLAKTFMTICTGALCLFFLTAGSAAARELENGLTLLLDGVEGDEQYFTFEVPPRAGYLRVELRAGSGDADLYLRRGVPPSRSEYDCRSNNSAGNDDACYFEPSTPGVWHVMVHGYTTFSEAELEPIFSFELRNGVSLTDQGCCDFFGQPAMYAFLDVPAGASNLEFLLSYTDADLFSWSVTYGSPPWEDGAHDCYSSDSVDPVDPRCSFESPREGRYHVWIGGYEIDDPTLLATFDAPSGCTPTETSLCLLDGRFKVEVEWRDFENVTGSGQVVELGQFASEDSGLLYFFAPDNWEMLVKMVDACNPPFNSFWVFASATTNVQYTLRVTDTETDQVRTWFNPLGTLAPAIADPQAFLTCP